MADRLKLAQGLRNLPASAREDLAGYPNGFSNSKVANYLRNVGEQGAGIAKSVARGVPQMATGFVDLAAMPLEYAGVLQPGQAVGSTKWLEEKGYLPPPQEGFINQTVEGLSSALDPSAMAVHALPAIGMLGKTVWHGSPHTFDKFDLSKIGTGEGAQSYGHGLYLAEAKPTAEEYRAALTGNHNLDKFNPTVNGEIVDTPVTKAIIRGGGNPEDFIKSLEPKLKSQTEKLNMASKEEVLPGISDYDMAMMDLADTQKMIDEAKSYFGKTIKNEPLGALYKVDLPDEQIAKMLDWDKPLSEQAPEVLQALEQSPQYQHFANINQQNPNLYQHPSEFEAKKFYGMIGESPEDASRILREQGIPGIQYLDQASRGAGEGTRNYVVFSDEIPQILERNNQPVGMFK